MGTSKILSLVEKHEALRTEGVNLVVSENRLSPEARSALASDLAGRYSADWYGGTAVAREIEAATESLAAGLFKADHALVSPLSGNLCVLAALFAFTRPGDAVAMLPFSAGGYPFGIEKFDRRRVTLPADVKTLAIDVEASAGLIRDERVKLVFLGSSGIPFPHPVREIRAAVDDASQEGILAYDGSHVLGLIACGVFQDPLGEGAHLLMGSTHKSFFGPQGGLILTRSASIAGALGRYLELDIEEGIGLVDNPHVNRIAAMGVALEEMAADPGYGRRVIENAKALARALEGHGLPVRFKDRDYTESHQVLLDLPFEESKRLCHRLENEGIFIDIGGRMGTAEVTHRGMGPEEMKGVAERIAAVYRDG